uniref:Uncharacterized protein n=1 Tax=Oryza barthii TaxID=65489 RepID=A0A0D3GU57_9ORYZ
MLTESNSDGPVVPDGRLIRGAPMNKHSTFWKGADILAFNSYLWWMTGEKIQILKGADEDMSKDIVEMEAEEAYRLVLHQVTRWLERNVDPKSARVFFVKTTPVGAADAALPQGWTAATSELGGVIKATKAVAMFQSLAVKHGAVLRDRMESGKGFIVVKTSSGEEFHGAKCIITVGAWASKLVKSVAGIDLPVRPGREHELTPEAGFPAFCCYGDTCIYSTPSMEFPGLIKVCMHGGAPCDPDRRDWCATGDALVDPVARIAGGAVDRRAHARPRRHRRRAGHPAVVHVLHTPDVDFIIDFVGGELGKDVVVGAGFSGHGFKMGPAVGRVLAEMAMDGEARTAAEAGVEVRHFRIGRFMDSPDGNLAENKVKS